MKQPDCYNKLTFLLYSIRYNTFRPKSLRALLREVMRRISYDCFSWDGLQLGP